VPHPHIQTRSILSSSPYARSGKGKGEAGRWLLGLPGPPELKIDRVWHYTDSRGLIGIVRDQRVWATSARMLNDSTEIQHGVDLFEGALQALLDESSLDENQRTFIARVHETTQARLDGNDSSLSARP
jgi:hypothetical protein